MNLTLSALALAATALVLVPATTAPALQDPPKLQFPQASPLCKLEQRVGVTDVALAFHRPSMKGRKIFGGLEPMGAVWRTGANEATTIEFSGPVKFGGVDVPAGKYALLSIPGEQEWTVILNGQPDQWGAYKYDEKADVARVKVRPIALAAPVETFAMGFSDLRSASATLYFEWERVRVPVEVATDVVTQLVPQIRQAMEGSGKKPYLGAAMFYYDNDLDLKQASAWIDQAIAEQPDAMWIVYRKGLILEKLGDKAGARAAAQKALDLASKAQGPIKDEYTRLSTMLLERLR